MPDNMYQVIALIPIDSDFSLKSAANHFGSLLFRKAPVRSELLKAKDNNSFTGLQVRYGDWSITAWIDESAGVLADSQDLVDDKPLPASAEIIGSCAKRLSIWSDEDPTGNHSDEMTHFTDELRKLFGLFIYDPVNGGWWT